MEPIREAPAPWDDPNQRLAANVHPADWVNPWPTSRYNLVVIGAGTAGLVTAAGAAGLGAKVAVIERHLMGGDCLNVSCVPSKAPIRSARAAKDARDGAITDGEEQGMVKLVTERGNGRIVGATNVARHAGEMISEISTARSGGVTLGKLACVIHPYPTQAEAIRKCGDQFNKARLTPTVKRLLAKWLAWRR